MAPRVLPSVNTTRRAGRTGRSALKSLSFSEWTFQPSFGGRERDVPERESDGRLRAKRLMTLPPGSWISTIDDSPDVARSVADQIENASSSTPGGFGPS